MPSVSEILSIQVGPVRPVPALKEKVYKALKRALMELDIYGSTETLKLDERALAESLGVSRTPVREALLRLEQEGLVRIVPRRGAFVVKKTKAEILDMIHVWAAIEGMAARLATVQASERQISRLRQLFTSFDDSNQINADIDEYSETNIAFHQAIVELGHNDLIRNIAEGLFIHMRAIRIHTIRQGDRATRSIIDHIRIIESIEQRDAGTAERLVREHALNLAKHVDKDVDYLN